LIERLLLADVGWSKGDDDLTPPARSNRD